MSNHNFLLNNTSSSASAINVAKPSVRPEPDKPSGASDIQASKDSGGFKAKLDHAESQYPAEKPHHTKEKQTASSDHDTHNTSPSNNSIEKENTSSGGGSDSSSIVGEPSHTEAIETSITSQELPGNGLPVVAVSLESAAEFNKTVPPLETSVLASIVRTQSVGLSSPLASTSEAGSVDGASLTTGSQLTETLPLHGLKHSVPHLVPQAATANTIASSDEGAKPQLNSLTTQQVLSATNPVAGNSATPVVAEAKLLANSIATEIAPLQAIAKGNMTDKLFLNKLAELASSGEKVDSLVEQLTAKFADTANSINGGPAAIQSATKIPGLPQLSTGVPFQQAQWSNSVAERVMWMSSQGVKEAEIQMDPPELGPLTVKVSVVNEQAQVSFSVQNTSVRESLDQSAVRLREMFAEEGLDLVDVDVSDHSQSEEGQEQETAFGTHSSNTDDSLPSEVLGETPLDSSIGPTNLVDAYI